jgi:hypothetical protein
MLAQLSRWYSRDVRLTAADAAYISANHLTLDEFCACLREVTPEAIARKTVLASSLCELLVLARPADPEWRERAPN